jgi:post-segregation antitoxin (ccd killing protein)
MLQLNLRDSLVRARVALINAVRFTLKSLGYPVSNPCCVRFHKLVLNEVPESIRDMIAHNVAAIAELTERIKALDTSISRLASAAIQRQSISSRSVEWGLLPHSTLAVDPNQFTRRERH